MKLKFASLASTALLLTMAYAPQASALSYNFSTTINAAIANGSGGTSTAPGPYTDATRLFNATFTTSATPTTPGGSIYEINSIVGATLGGGNPTNFVTNITPGAGGVLGYINTTTGRITGLDFTFTRDPQFLYMPWEMTFANYTTAGILRVDTYDQNQDGGRSAATLTQIPEIDGGMLPRAIMVLSGVFLMYFGRKRTEDLA